MSADDTFSTLLNYLRQFRSDLADSRKPVFWLGAGCSVFDGIPLNDDLLQEIVPAVPGAWGSPQFRFDRFCDAVGPGASRALLFEKHFRRKLKDDSPYKALARLLMAGYADLVFTFNIDDLLEQALAEAAAVQGTDYLALKVPELRPAVALDMMRDGGGPRVRVVKLHGDYRAGFNCMTSTEIVEYEENIRELVAEFSKRAAIVCGYSFFHLNVLESFSRRGGSFFYVNRSFPRAPMVLSLMASRSTAPLFIDGPLGHFENCVGALATELRV